MNTYIFPLITPGSHIHILSLVGEKGVVLEAPYNLGQAQGSMSHMWLSSNIIGREKLQNSCPK